MKPKSLLFLFIILQCISCNKRYLFLKKVRVPHDNKQASVAVEQKKKKAEPFHSDNGLDIDSIENSIPDEANSSSKPILIPNKQWRDAKPQKFIQPEKKFDKSDSNKKEAPTTRLNNRALVAFIYTILAIVTIPIIFAIPLMGVLLAAIFTFLTFYNARIAIKEFKQTPQKGRWMAIVGLIFVALVFAGIIASAIILLFTMDSYEVNETAVLTSFIALVIGFFILLLRSLLRVKEPKTPPAPAPQPPGQRRSKPLKPDDPKRPAPDKWNRFAIAAFAIGIIAGLMIVTGVILFIRFMPYTATLFFSLAGFFFLASILLSIVAFRQIKSTHRKGKWLAWIGILFAPFVFVLLDPVFLIPFALIGLLCWIIIRAKRKKTNKVSLS